MKGKRNVNYLHVSYNCLFSIAMHFNVSKTIYNSSAAALHSLSESGLEQITFMLLHLI